VNAAGSRRREDDVRRPPYGVGVNRTDRLYALVEELRAVAPGARSATWLAQRFEVSTRTIERDLGALQEAGVPIFATPGRRGGYAIDTQHTLPPLNLTAGEVAAIATALAREGATPFTDAGRTALQKILAVLRTVEAEATRSLADRIRVFDTAGTRARPPAVVEHAIVQRRVLELDYVDKTGRPSTRAVEPVAVLGVHPSWYLWAWCRLRAEPRAFRLDRIAGARMLDEVAPDRGLDPQTVEIPDLAGRGILS
jgi:predicted DNA-binding transcriptional regulator YafY